MKCLLFNDYLWSREKTKEIWLVVLGGALGRHTTRAGRGTKRLQAPPLVGNSKAKWDQSAKAFAQCLCMYLYLHEFICIFRMCFSVLHLVFKSDMGEPRPCIMPRIERPRWGKPISGYNATQPDALIEISHSRLGRLCQMYSELARCHQAWWGSFLSRESSRPRELVRQS